MKTKRIFIWTDRPPFFTKEPFIALKDKGFEVTFIYKRDDKQNDRTSVHDSKKYNGCKAVEFSNIATNKSELLAFFKNNDGAIHVVNGFYLSKRLKYRELKKIAKNSKFYLLTELPQNFRKPSIIFSFLNSINSALKAILNQKYIDGVFAFGEAACKYFIRHFWPKNKIHNFMYSFDFNKVKAEKKNNNVFKHNKFLYIGRFDYEIKGVNYLLKACDILTKQNVEFTLDFVGGYGKNREQVLKYIGTHQNCKMLGTVEFYSLLEMIKQYDCIIVPSRRDGWNINNLMALCSGVPVITTNGAGSDDLVKTIGFGFVVRKSKPSEISNAMKEVIYSSTNATGFKNNATKFANKFSSEKLGDFVKDIFENKQKDLYYEIVSK